MGKDGGQGGLRVGPGPRRNSRAEAQGRVPPIGGNHQRGAQVHASRDGQRGPAGLGLESFGLAVEKSEARGGPGSIRQAVDEGCVFDIPTEGGKPDFRAAKHRRRRPEQAAGIVDEAHGFEWRGLSDQGRPDAERFEEANRSAEQGHRPPVAPGIEGADQGRRESIPGEREGRRQTGSASTHDGDVIRTVGHARSPEGRALPKGNVRNSGAVISIGAGSGDAEPTIMHSSGIADPSDNSL